MAAGKLRPVIDKTCPLERIAEAFKYVERAQEGQRCDHRGALMSGSMIRPEANGFATRERIPMERAYRKKSYPLDEIRRFLEPGPIVLVSSAWQGSFNIMTMGWHMMLGFSPALFGCYIWDENHSYQMLRRSKECVINLPTLDLVDTVVGIGNCHGADVDKFERFGLTPKRATKVAAP